MDADNGKEEFGRYEKRLLFLLLLSAVPNSFSSLQFLATHYTPDFYCSTSANATGVGITGTPDFGESTQSLKQVGLNQSARSENACWLQNSSFTAAANMSQDYKIDQSRKCKKFQFKGSVKTVVTEFSIVCNKAWLKPLLTSLYMAGKMFGGMLGGFVSDRYGRRRCFLCFTALQFILSLLTSFSSSISMYAVFLTLSGLTSVANFEAAVVIASEMVSVQRRGLAFFCVEIGFATGYMILALLTYLFVSWRWFLVFGGLVGFLYVPYYWLIDETPTWLLATGQRDRAEKTLQKISEYNCRSSISAVQLSLIEAKLEEEISSATVWSTFAQLRKECFLAGRLAVVLLSWIAAALTYYAITLNNDNLSGDRFLNIFYGSVTEFLSSFIYYFGVTRLGRRKSYMGFMVITGAAVVASPFLAKWNGTAAMVASMLAKLSVAVAYNVLFPYNNELFPTNIRNTVLSLSSGVSRIGSMVAPFIIFAGENGDTIAPSVGMAVLVLLSAASYQFVPETKNTKLPQTIAEAKNLKRLRNPETSTV